MDRVDPGSLANVTEPMIPIKIPSQAPTGERFLNLQHSNIFPIKTQSCHFQICVFIQTVVKKCKKERNGDTRRVYIVDASVLLKRVSRAILDGGCVIMSRKN